MPIIPTPAPPYYAVIFTAEQSDDLDGYAEMSKELHEKAHEIPGFLGLESAGDHFEITVSYWESLDAIDRWRRYPLHQRAKARGRTNWFKRYCSRICKVERQHFHPE